MDYIAVKDPGPSAQLANDWLTSVRVGQRYSVSAKFMRQTGYRGSLRIGIRWKDQAGATITDSWSASLDDPSPVAGDTVWQEVTCRDLICPSNGYKASLVVEVGVSGLTDHSGAAIWFDNTDMGENFRFIHDIDGVLDGITHRRVGAGYVDGLNRITRYFEPALDGGTPRSLSGSFTPSAFRPVFPRNGGFSSFSGVNGTGDPPDWWTETAGAWGTDVTVPDREGLVPIDGDGYLRFMPTEPAATVQSEWFPVEGGTARVFTFLIANISLAADPRVVAEWGDGYQGFLAEDTHAVDYTALAPDEWTKGSFELTAPATAGWVRLRIERDDGASIAAETTGEFLFGGFKTVDPTTAGAVTLGDVGFAPNTKAATLAAGVLTLQPAAVTFDAGRVAYPGVVSELEQLFDGPKKFLAGMFTPVISGCDVYGDAFDLDLRGANGVGGLGHSGGYKATLAGGDAELLAEGAHGGDVEILGGKGGEQLAPGEGGAGPGGWVSIQGGYGGDVFDAPGQGGSVEIDGGIGFIASDTEHLGDVFIGGQSNRTTLGNPGAFGGYGAGSVELFQAMSCGVEKVDTSGTPGNATAHSISGRAAIASGETSVEIVCSFVKDATTCVGVWFEDNPAQQYTVTCVLNPSYNPLFAEFNKFVVTFLVPVEADLKFKWAVLFR